MATSDERVRERQKRAISFLESVGNSTKNQFEVMFESVRTEDNLFFSLDNILSKLESINGLKVVLSKEIKDFKCHKSTSRVFEIVPDKKNLEISYINEGFKKWRHDSCLLGIYYTFTVGDNCFHIESFKKIYKDTPFYEISSLFFTLYKNDTLIAERYEKDKGCCDFHMTEENFRDSIDVNNLDYIFLYIKYYPELVKEFLYLDNHISLPEVPYK